MKLQRWLYGRKALFIRIDGDLFEVVKGQAKVSAAASNS